MLSQNNNSSVIYSREAVENLTRKAKQGDKKAFAILYENFLTPLYRYVLSRCGDTKLAEDVCQTTFLRFYEALPRYEAKESLNAYLFTIARRLLINEHQKFKPESFDDEILDSFEGEEKFLEEIDTKIIFNHIEEMLKTLTQNEQDVINLLYMSELSVREVAQVLERNEDSIRQIKHRALKKIQTSSKKYL